MSMNVSKGVFRAETEELAPEVECDDCDWCGRFKDTDVDGDCPDCGGETFKIEEAERDFNYIAAMA